MPRTVGLRMDEINWPWGIKLHLQPLTCPGGSGGWLQKPTLQSRLVSMATSSTLEGTQEPLGQPPKQLTPSEIPRIWGAQYPENG